MCVFMTRQREHVLHWLAHVPDSRFVLPAALRRGAYAAGEEKLDEQRD